jgi:hypothetical protein
VMIVLIVVVKAWSVVCGLDWSKLWYELLFILD